MNEDKKAELTKFIQDALGYAYCDNCRGNDDMDFEGCDNCHRKYIGWEIRPSTAARIAEKAAQIFSEED